MNLINLKKETKLAENHVSECIQYNLRFQSEDCRNTVVHLTHKHINGDQQQLYKKNIYQAYSCSIFKYFFLKVISIFQQHPYSPSSSTSAESSSQAVSTSPTIPFCDTFHKYQEM